MLQLENQILGVFEGVRDWQVGVAISTPARPDSSTLNRPLSRERRSFRPRHLDQVPGVLSGSGVAVGVTGVGVEVGSPGTSSVLVGVAIGVAVAVGVGPGVL